MSGTRRCPNWGFDDDGAALRGGAVVARDADGSTACAAPLRSPRSETWARLGTRERHPKGLRRFRRRAGRIFSTSEPFWPTFPTAPTGAPNVIVMLADDLKFADLACYGSEIDTPNLDALAAGGVRYTNFHVNPMCSPTRSMLTGLNHHMAGMGHVAHSDPGFPGYTMNCAATPSRWPNCSATTAGPRSWSVMAPLQARISPMPVLASWPLQKGFERYYGILDGFMNFHQLHRLYEDNHHIPVDQYPDDYYHRRLPIRRST